jgi:hypothetical protein
LTFRASGKFILLALAICASLCSSAWAEPMKSAVDPTDMGVGGRPLGMGRAFVGTANDSNSIFLNPAGLPVMKSWQMTSMYSKLLGQIDYTLLGFAHSFSREAVGIGYLRVGIDGSRIITYRDPYTGRILPTHEGMIGYLSSVAYLTYGASLRRFLSYEFLDDIYLGTSAKVFNQEIKGGTFEALAAGFDMDLGLQWKAKSWLTIGAVAQNFLPSSAGGNVRWTSGIEETLPSSYVIGIGAKLLGRDAPWQYIDQELYFDYDFEMSEEKLPSLGHLGLEWWPIEYFALRCGIDQDSAAKEEAVIGVDNNLTLGVALYFHGVQFDYAFHQFGSLSENNTHFFSMTIGVDREKPKEQAKPVLKSKYINAIYPAREAVIYNDHFLISGEVEPEVAYLKAGDATAEAVGRRFAIDLNVTAEGKNPFMLEAYNSGGRKLDGAKIKVLRLPSFADVDMEYWAHDAVSYIAAIGLIKGYPDAAFKPDASITRAEIATVLVRALGQKLPLLTEKNVFKDVPDSHWAAAFIKASVLNGLVIGYPDGTFKPQANINRAESVVLISRFGGIAEPKTIFEKPYPDLPQTHWAIKMISAAKEAGLLKYLENGNFEPKKNLTRAEAVEILSRTKFAGDRIGELLNFDIGY